MFEGEGGGAAGEACLLHLVHEKWNFYCVQNSCTVIVVFIADGMISSFVPKAHEVVQTILERLLLGLDIRVVPDCSY